MLRSRRRRGWGFSPRLRWRIQPAQQMVDALQLFELAAAPGDFFPVGKLAVEGAGFVIIEKQRALDQKSANDAQPGFAPKG